MGATLTIVVKSDRGVAKPTAASASAPPIEWRGERVRVDDALWRNRCSQPAANRRYTSSSECARESRLIKTTPFIIAFASRRVALRWRPPLARLRRRRAYRRRRRQYAKAQSARFLLGGHLAQAAKKQRFLYCRARQRADNKLSSASRFKHHRSGARSLTLVHAPRAPRAAHVGARDRSELTNNDDNRRQSTTNGEDDDDDDGGDAEVARNVQRWRRRRACRSYPPHSNSRLSAA